MRSTLILPCACLVFAQAPQPPAPPFVPSAEERSQIIAGATELGKRLSLIRVTQHDVGLLNDVEVYHKAAAWLLRHPEEFYNRNYLESALLVLDRGVARAKALQEGKSPWVDRKGRVIRAYRSRVDGSVQPYAVVVPESYDGSKPVRLDLVLHGRGATLSEVSFIAQTENAKPGTTYPDRLELHVFGRTNNAYRWSGETDVFEALDSVKSRYKVDTDRIVLRGFSMGGAGTWHIGLHHPGLWAGIEAGAGFNETMTYARQSSLPEYQSRTLHIYDAFEYARNIMNVPAVGYGGDQDPQLRASQNIQTQLKAEGIEGLRALFLVGPQTGHRFHPESKKESDKFLDMHAARGRLAPDPLSFVTYTTRYNECHWVRVDGLEKHYERAQVDAQGGRVTTKNVSHITLRRLGALELDGQKFPQGGAFEKVNGRWRAAGEDKSLRKRHGLQGPIDDAFHDSFVLVRPTGKAVHGETANLASDRMNRFTTEFAKWLRGDPRVVDDTSVTSTDIRDHNLVLFGEPSNNALIAKIAGKLPIRWDREGIRVNRKAYDSASHVLVMIYPNPLNLSRYVVLNSGHTFGEREFKGTNALLFPRLGDWAVLDLKGNVVAAGLFDDLWKLAPGS